MAKKTLGNTDVNGTKKNVPDVKIFGNGDLFQLLSKASSEKEGWMKSTKAMEISTGCVVQTTTQQRNPDGSYSCTDALAFVPGVKIKISYSYDGIIESRELVSIKEIKKEIKIKLFFNNLIWKTKK
jgi:hypothetical protein